MALKVKSHYVTDVGMVRKNNEDFGFADPQGRFFICADGMGGHAAGEVASRMAVAELAANLESWPVEFDQFAEAPDPDRQRNALDVLEYLVKSVNVSVHERGKAEPDKRGMGCTIEVAVVVGSFVLCAHVGDSRQYLLRRKQAQRLTQDHSFTPPTEPGQPAGKGMLWSALGPFPVCTVDTFAFSLEAGDRVIMCSDGLTDYFPDQAEISAVIEQHGDEQGVRQLVEIAKQRGGRDNITVLLFAAEPPAPVQVNRAFFRSGPAEKTMASGEQRRLPPGVRATIPADRGEGSLLARRMIAFAASAMFEDVPATEISKVLANATEVSLPAGRPIPRNVEGVDCAWMVVDGTYRGWLVYPEALVYPQHAWRELVTPNEDLLAVGLNRADFHRYTLASPNHGIQILGNVAKLVAGELRRYLDAAQVPAPR
jgi:serine/threonine protein phosphatase PrpC